MACYHPKKAEVVRERLSKETGNPDLEVIAIDLKEVGFKIIQTTSSFYVTFYANNAYELAEKLESKHVFLVPLSNNLIRIAVSGLNIEEISKLPSIIKETYNEQ